MAISTMMIHFLILRMTCYLIIISMRNKLGILGSIRRIRFNHKIIKRKVPSVRMRSNCLRFSNLRKAKIQSYFRENKASLN